MAGYFCHYGMMVCQNRKGNSFPVLIHEAFMQRGHRPWFGIRPEMVILNQGQEIKKALIQTTE